MPKIGRTLSYINTERKGKSTEQSSVSQSLGSSRPGGSVSMPQGDYLLKSIWDKVFEIRTDCQGIEYIFGKLPMVTQYGITMYSGDGVNVPSLASGLPFDGRTIWYNPDTNQIEVIGGTGGGGEGGVSNFWDLNGIPSWITNSKPKYTYSEIEGTPDLSVYALKSQIPSLSGYATESWVKQQDYALGDDLNSLAAIVAGKADSSELAKYIPIQGYTDILGEKNFTEGLKVNGSPIVYDSSKKYWKLEGDLLVTGGVTMYGNDSSFVPSTIMDAINVDGTTISKEGGVLKVIGGTGGGSVEGLANVAYSGKYDDLIGKPTLLSSFTDDVVSGKYLPLSGGTINGELYVSSTSTNRAIIRLISAADVPNDLLFGSNGEYHWSITSRNIEEGRYIGLYNNKEGSNGWVFKASFDTRVLDFMNTPTVNGSAIWYSGNDGDGSGLDADLLDGKHLSDLKIWGQNFDGTGNINGILSLNYNSSTSGIELTREGNNESSIAFNNGYGRSVIGSWGNGTHLWIQGVGNIISASMTNGYVGFGMTNPKAKVHVDGNLFIGTTPTNYDSTRKVLSLISSGENPCDFILGSDDTQYWSISARNKSDGQTGKALLFHNYLKGAALVISQENYLGVGETKPTARLHINGNAKIYSENAGILSLYRTSADGGSYIDYYSMNQTTSKWRVGAAMTDTFYWENQNGKVVGRFVSNNTTGTRFEVGKSFLNIQGTGSDVNRAVMTLISESDYPTDLIMGANKYAWSITTRGSDEDYLLGFYSGVSTKYAMKIYKEGNVLVTGGITMQGTSDKRLKKNIRTLSASDTLMSLGGVYQFEYTDDEIERNSRYKGTHFGLIYQNVKQTSLAKMCYEREDGYGALNYLDTSFISLLAGVGMEHETRIQKLERENKQLRQELERLKSA